VTEILLRCRHCRYQQRHRRSRRPSSWESQEKGEAFHIRFYFLCFHSFSFSVTMSMDTDRKIHKKKQMFFSRVCQILTKTPPFKIDVNRTMNLPATNETPENKDLKAAIAFAGSFIISCLVATISIVVNFTNCTFIFLILIPQTHTADVVPPICTPKIPIAHGIM
jgi:hypothetical protein